MLHKQQQKQKKKQKKSAYNKRRRIAAKQSSRPCEFDFGLLTMLNNCVEEEYCRDEDGCVQRRHAQRARKAQADDVYRDDFSSDDSDNGKGDSIGEERKGNKTDNTMDNAKVIALANKALQEFNNKGKESAKNNDSSDDEQSSNKAKLKG